MKIMYNKIIVEYIENIFRTILVEECNIVSVYLLHAQFEFFLLFYSLIDDIPRGVDWHLPKIEI